MEKSLRRRRKKKKVLSWGKGFRGDLPGQCSGARGQDSGARGDQTLQGRDGSAVLRGARPQLSLEPGPGSPPTVRRGCGPRRRVGGRSAPPAPGLRPRRPDPTTDAQAEHCAKLQLEPPPGAAPGLRGLPARGSLTSASGVPLQRSAARRAGRESSDRRVARRPRQPRPALQPLARPPGRRSRLSASGPSQRPGTRRADDCGPSRAVRGAPWNPAPSPCVRPPQLPLPARSHPLLSLSLRPLATPPPGSRPCSAVPPQPRPQFPPSCHAALFCHLVAWKGTK